MEITILLGLFTGSVWKIIGESSTFGIFILLVLAFMSLTSWVIIFHKYRQFKQVSEDTNQFISQFDRSHSLADVLGQAKSYQSSPLSTIYRAGLDELKDLHKRKNEGGGLQENFSPLDSEDFEIVEMIMEKTMTEQITVLEKQVVFLASTSSAAPFMGLLGTVVGIMDSFWSIGERGSASLAVVAPGIAEALLATIVGLGAAIPAVIAYNWANNNIKRQYDRSAGFILQFISRAKKETR
jgi:biopolymer transport protein TolQ